MAQAQPGGRLENIAASPQIQGFKLAHPNIYTVMNCKTSITQGNNGISERSSGEDPESLVKQKPEAVNQTKRLNAKNTCKQSCTTQHSFHSEMFALLLLFSFGGEFARVEGTYGATGR